MNPSRSSRPLRDVQLAFTLLTVVPLRAEWPERERPDVAGYFPLVGLALGGFAWAIATLMTWAMPAEGDVASALLVAAIIVASLGLSTRFLHWDGLADVADAWGGSPSPQRRFEILDDPHVGAFGAGALVCVALLQVTAVAALIGDGALLAIALAPAIARYAAVFGAWFGRAARPHGLGASVAGAPRPPSVVAAVAVLAAVAVAAALAEGAFLVVAVAGIVAALAIPHLLASRFGGVTGDVLGSSVMLTETVVLVGFAITR